MSNEQNTTTMTIVTNSSFGNMNNNTNNNNNNKGNTQNTTTSTTLPNLHYCLLLLHDTSQNHQVVQCTGRCRVLHTENGELRGELERARAQLKEAKRRGAVAGTLAENLRLKSLENGLLVEELGAVRQDCGRLVQLVRCGGSMHGYNNR